MRFGDLLFASKARCGPFPLRWTVLAAGTVLRGRGRSHLFTQKGTLSTLMLSLQGLRGTRPALAGKLGGGGAFALCARQGLIASNARSGPIGLPLGLGANL